MSAGFGIRDWNTTVPLKGPQWPARDEFDGLSGRAFAGQLRSLRRAGPLQPGDIALISVVRNERRLLSDGTPNGMVI